MNYLDVKLKSLQLSHLNMPIDQPVQFDIVIVFAEGIN